jgi:DNA-binding GntR family transcriptional regulator
MLESEYDAAMRDVPPVSPLGQSPTTHAQLATGAIKEAILAGRLAPGELLVERRIAAMLGVSKTPVREALISLARSGLVRLSVNRGVRVAELSSTDMLKVYQLRLLLEPWAIGETARLGSIQVVRQARRLLDGAEVLAAAGEHGSLILANREFHQVLYGACDNQLVVQALDDLQDLTALGVVSLLWQKWPTWDVESHEHDEILGAVAAQDSRSAEQAVRRHIEASLSRLSGDAQTSERTA